MAHGVARFSPKYCGNDWMRLITIGKSEGKWWLDNAFCGGEKAVNNLKSWGFLEDVVNYKFFEGFKDPWEVEKISHIKIGYGIMHSGKLDWLITRKTTIVDKFFGNHDYSLSDHKYLGVIIILIE